MSYVLCAPVVAQVGLLGAPPPDGLYEGWCNLDTERWGVGNDGLGTLSAECSGTFGYLTATTNEDITEDFEDFHYWGVSTQERFDLRGYRVWTRLEAPDIAAPLAEVALQVSGVASSDFPGPNPPSYIAVALIRLRRNSETGAAEFAWFIQSVGNVASGSLPAVPATSQWVAFRVAEDGQTWYVERSDDCGTWEVVEEFTPGVPERSLYTSAGIAVLGGVDETPAGGIVPAGSTWRIGPIFIQRAGNPPTPTPEPVP